VEIYNDKEPQQVSNDTAQMCTCLQSTSMDVNYETVSLFP